MKSLSRIACFVVFACLPAVTVGQSYNQKVTYRVRVIQITGAPVAGAEVAVLAVIFDWADGQASHKLLEKKKTGLDGTTAISVELNIDTSKDAVVVARSKSLAIGWHDLNRASLPVDGTELVILLDKPCVLAGKVVDEAGKAVAGARVLAEVASSYYLRNENRINAPEDWLTIKTDAEGRFCFDNIPPDASADFFVTAPGKAYTWTFMATDSMPGYSYAAGRADIQIVLPAEARVQGHVVGPDGCLVSGVKLLLRPNKGVANYYCTCRTVSGADGQFLFENVPADAYSLQVVAPMQKMAEWVGRDIKVVAKSGETTNNIVIRVNKGGVVEAIVCDRATGRPIQNAYVSLNQKANFGKHPCFYQTCRTDFNGKAQIRAPLGKCNFAAGSERYEYFQGTLLVTERPSPPMKILLAHYPEASGTVRDQSGQAAAGAVVAAVPPGHTAVRTDTAGKFYLCWRVESKETYLFARDERRNLAAAVEVKELSRPVEIVLKPALILVGRVTDPNGVPTPAAKIQLVIRCSNWLAYAGTKILTDANGRFEIPAVPPPQKDFNYCINVDAAGFCSIEHERILVEESSGKQVDLGIFVLQPLNMSISGIVVDAGGRPVPNKIIHLSGLLGAGGQPRKSIITDENGRFYFNRVCKGPFRLQAGWAREKDVGFVNANAGDRDVKVILGKREEQRPDKARR
jgi:hypothetical protein